MTPAKKKDNAPGSSIQPQPQPPAPTPAVKQEEKKEVAPVVSRQDAMLAKLKEAWTERKVDLSKLTATMDGKFLNVVVGPEWPVIAIGPTGGLSLPTIRSYPKAWDAALEADKLLAKQTERMAKKTATAAPTSAAPETKKPQAATVTARKKKADQKLEQHLQEA